MGSVSNGTGVAAEKVISLKPFEFITAVAALSNEKALKLEPQRPLPLGEFKHNKLLPVVVWASKIAAVIAPLVKVKEFVTTLSHRTALLLISKEPHPTFSSLLGYF